MRKFFVRSVLMAGVLISMPAWSSCDGGSDEPKPEWVSKPDFSLQDYYVGVGSAEKGWGSSNAKQSEASESNAKMQLVQQIEVTIKAENAQSMRVSNRGVEMDALSKVTVSAEEVLRDLKIKGRWLDKDSCILYTLMAISKQSVAQSKREKTMKNRLGKFKELLSEGTNRGKNPDVNVRRKNLEEAQSLLGETDFSVLSEEIGKKIYAKRIGEALALVNKEASQAKGRMALFAITQDGSLREDVLGKMLDQLRSRDRTADRLMAECKAVDDCIGRAKEQGFSMIALLKAGTQVERSAMGSLKGTITISRTVYNIDGHKILKGPDTVSAQVIGWSNEEIDWGTAAERAMQSLK